MIMKRKKIIAPIVISVLVIVYYAVYFGVLIYLLDTVWAWLLGLIPIALAGTMIYVCKQRIDEIKGGEEDDLGNY